MQLHDAGGALAGNGPGARSAGGCSGRWRRNRKGLKRLRLEQDDHGDHSRNKNKGKGRDDDAGAGGIGEELPAC